jgi:hypothetical protein
MIRSGATNPTTVIVAARSVHLKSVRRVVMMLISPNAKLTDDEERASDASLGTEARPRSSSFGPAAGSPSRHHPKLGKYSL